jgi:predicted transposase/invertase (TIGR01784 family)
MTKTQDTTHTRKHRPLEELDLMDDFLFQQVIAQEEDGEEFCRILLSTILGKPIRKVRVIPQKNILGIDTSRHGIRMDAYIEAISGEELMPGVENVVDAEVAPDIYDIEPNKKSEKEVLPKRMRYYHALIDTQLLTTSAEYDRLQNVVIIVILPYDPFDRNRMVYTIKNQCVEDFTVPYEDGATKIFLYTKGTEGHPSQDLQDMLKYIEETTNENVTNQNLAAMQRLVDKVKRRREVGISYMKSWEIEKMYRDEERALGREEGREEGIYALIKTCREFHATKEETALKVVENFKIQPADAEDYLRQYWE